MKFVLASCFLIIASLPAMAQYGSASSEAELTFLLSVMQYTSDLDRNDLIQRYGNDASLENMVMRGYRMCNHLTTIGLTTGQSAQSFIDFQKLTSNQRRLAEAAHQNLCPEL